MPNGTGQLIGARDVTPTPQEAIILLQIRTDVEASQKDSLDGVTLYPMRTHQHGKRFHDLELLAWTNSSAVIFVDTDAISAGVSDLQKDENGGRTLADATLFMRGFAALAIRHEVTHILQFLQIGRPPANFKQMVTFEREGYGCQPAPSPPTSTAVTANAGFLNNNGSGGPQDFLENTLKLSIDDAVEIVKQHREGASKNCAQLKTLISLTSDDEIKTKLIRMEFLPNELVDGNGGTYQLEDLYQADRIT
jgi:hypothetical protein